MSLPDMTTMCPKHGVAHGVCVDPVRAEIPTLEGACREVVETYKTYEDEKANRITIVESPRPDESVGDCCPECGGYVFNPETTPPNRFDPFEALDTIHDTATEIAAVLETLKVREVIKIQEQIRLLRAYITGMEK